MEKTVALDILAEDRAWDAFVRRDRAQDGDFVVGVRTTGIYCRPSCPARRPRRENVEFFADGHAARLAGYRACKRCLPDDESRDGKAVKQALGMMNAAEERVSLEQLASAVGYAPHHFQRLFKRSVGVTPAAYGRQLRARRLEHALDNAGDVTGAVYEAGYESAATAYSDAGKRLGMTPTARKKGGAGERIRFTIADSSLGAVLIAATQKGLCRISFDEGEAELRAHFPHADIAPSDSSFAGLVNDIVSAIDDPRHMRSDLPLDVRGTAFQQAVWQALRTIPTGETRTYSEIATAVGRPNAIRAAGTACGDNALAVVIPCHRVVRTDGGLGGYAYGLDRKKVLLAREGGASKE